MRGQLRLDDYEDPFASYVLPRYFEGRPVYEQLKIIALKLAAEKETITADDLREYCPPGVNKKVLGAVIGALKRKGYLREVGVVKSAVPSSHGRAIWVYRITDEGRAYLFDLLEVRA